MLVFTSLTMFSQETNDNSVFLKPNEVKINVGAVAFGLPEINYERLLLNADMGIGVAGMFSIASYEHVEYQIMPFYRMYFAQRRPCSGFFIEVNIGIVGQKNEYDYLNYETGEYYYEKEERDVFFGAGVAVGIKWMNSRGLVGEAFGGVGRLYGDPYSEVYPRVGISLGKRF